MFDEQGHVHITPKVFLTLVEQNPKRLINDILIRATPVAFADYNRYCDFLHVISDRLQVHPMNIFVRGSCQLGFSITPRPEKVWMQMTEKSDVDLAIVDVDYFQRLNQELRFWEAENPDLLAQGEMARKHAKRIQNRGFRCIDDKHIPKAVCVWHSDCMEGVNVGDFCGMEGGLSAFVFRDWWALRSRYEYDLRELRLNLEKDILPEPEDNARPRS